MDAISWATFLGALAATGFAVRAARRGHRRPALAALVATALLLHGNLAAHWWLSRWDERYHALVATHLMEHPLTPTLVEHPLDNPPPSDWTGSRVWLHKPPVALWLMAGSMATFGHNELALRVPSVVAAGLGVLVTYGIAALAVGPTAALFAAGFQAWCSRLALLSAGLRATDHVDALFIFFVALAVWLGLRAADAFARERARAGWLWTLATGVGVGVAYLTKAAPAAVALATFGVATLRQGRSVPERFGAPAVAFAVALAVAAPWLLYTAHAFPRAFAYAHEIPVRYFLEPVDGHAAPWTFHFRNLARYFGLFAWIALVPFFVEALRRRREWLPLVVWFALTYGVFSLAATKMKSYVFIALPVFFIALGWLCTTHLATRSRRTPRRRRLLDLGVALVVGSYVLTGALKNNRPWDPPPRRLLLASELRYLGREVRALPSGRWAVFAAPAGIEAMFYAPATVTQALPSPASVAAAQAKGFRIAVYGSRDDPRFADLQRRSEDVRFLAPDPAAAPARRIARALQTLHLRDPLVVNARHPRDLDAYLKPSAPSEVLGAVSPNDRALRRAVARKRPIVVLSRPGQRLGALAALRGVHVVVDAAEAR